MLQAYGLGPEAYYQQLADGMKAIKSDATGQTYPDHKVRKDYHDKLGRLLGIEQSNNSEVTINFNKIATNQKQEYGI